MSDTPDSPGPISRAPRAAKADSAADQSGGLPGSTDDDPLRRARLQAGILNLIAMAAAVWAVAYPRPYGLVVALLAVLPVAAIGLVIASRGAVTLDTDRKSVLPTAAYAILVPCMVQGVRALEDWHILGWSGFWLPFWFVAAVLIVVLLFAAAADGQGKVTTVVLIALVLLAQSYGLVLFMNCEFDRSVPVIHRTVVTSRRISHGRRSTSYYLTVGPWIDGGYSEEIKVPSSTYDWHEEGSTVLIGVRPGTLSMPWYFVQ
jgi:hypothetical protein